MAKSRKVYKLDNPWVREVVMFLQPCFSQSPYNNIVTIKMVTITILTYMVTIKIRTMAWLMSVEISEKRHFMKVLIPY